MADVTIIMDYKSEIYYSFAVYLTILSLAQSLYSWMIGQLVSNELKRI
jgi:hypothetical protein